MSPLDRADCTPRGSAFLTELEQLCEKHKIGISLGSHSDIDVCLVELDTMRHAVEGYYYLGDELI